MDRSCRDAAEADRRPARWLLTPCGGLCGTEADLALSVVRFVGDERGSRQADRRLSRLGTPHRILAWLLPERLRATAQP